MAIPDGAFTVIVGPNACGKSTLLRALCRLLKPSAGEVMLDGKNISSFATKALARELGLLPQTSIAPDSITVADLVSRGRYPHQSLLETVDAGRQTGGGSRHGGHQRQPVGGPQR